MLVRPWGPNCLILEAKTFKISAKFVQYRGCGADAFLERSWVSKRFPHTQFPGPFWEPFSIKNRKNGIQKGIQKLMPKKHRKMMPKGSQNDAKMDAKMKEFLICYEFVTFWKSSIFLNCSWLKPRFSKSRDLGGYSYQARAHETSSWPISWRKRLFIFKKTIKNWMKNRCFTTKYQKPAFDHPLNR